MYRFRKKLLELGATRKAASFLRGRGIPVTHATVSAWRTGKSRPKPHLFKMIVEKCPEWGITLEDYFEE